MLSQGLHALSWLIAVQGFLLALPLVYANLDSVVTVQRFPPSYGNARYTPPCSNAIWNVLAVAF